MSKLYKVKLKGRQLNFTYHVVAPLTASPKEIESIGCEYLKSLRYQMYTCEIQTIATSEPTLQGSDITTLLTFEEDKEEEK